MNKNENPPNLKSASGSGFSFEDKVTAFLLSEMLAGKSSLGRKWGFVERLERQAGDWEPFGDLLLTVTNLEGQSAKCGCSVKSNRQVNINGCSPELRDAFWQAVGKQVFNQQYDCLGLFCAELSNEVSPALNQMCRQAGEEDRPRRLDEKITDKKHRKIYDSFCHASDTGDAGLPWHILARLILREFDFEDATSRSEETAVTVCREILASNDAGMGRPRELWKELLDIARELRDSGGSATRANLASKLRHKFRLRDDPSDLAAWDSIRSSTLEWMDQIETTLPGGLRLPRVAEMDTLRKNLTANNGFHVLGESGSGKSALVKEFIAANAASGSNAEIVWIKADQFERMYSTVRAFDDVLRRTRFPLGLLIIDALDACYNDDALRGIGRSIAALSADADSPWKVVLICQTPEWSRVSRRLVKAVAGHDVLTSRVLCGDLSSDDMALVFEASPSIRLLASQPRTYRMLSSAKMLDLLLSGQIEEKLTLAGEVDLVDWWWQECVMGGKQFSAEEGVARKLATRMADDLTTEVSPDSAEGPANAVETLIRKRVLRRSRDGRLRFDHDLLADWSRVMHLRSLGNDVLTFMRAKTENPPWLRAIRLLSQHLLERAPDLERWRSVVSACSLIAEKGKEPPAGDLQVLDAWLEGIAFCTDAPQVLENVRADLFAQDGWLFQRFARRLLHTGTIPDLVFQKQFEQFTASSSEVVSMLVRLPRPVLWQPVVEFLVANPNEATEFIPVELAEIGAMWARLEEYLQITWPALANLVLLNGEKELRREVAGEYRHDHTSRGLGGGNSSRASIYRSALRAASQHPERAAKLALKAAGRIPWEDGDLSAEADESWRGEWRRHGYGGYGTYVKEPIESWPDGPTRRVSSDFYHAWFEGNAALALYRKLPVAACEATLALMIDWPKSEIIRGHHSTDAGRHGFRFEADHMYPAFWMKGPFIAFLRENWRPALDLVIRITNFATSRYMDWWPYEPAVAEFNIESSEGLIHWMGNRQVYAWNSYHMNTAQVVTCALMALEKWLDEQIGAKVEISEASRLLYKQGFSLAFAGVLISVGKRHPEEFIKDLKPLLFVREIYILDLHAVMQHMGGGLGHREGEYMNKLRREWNQLPGRRKSLQDSCLEWLLSKTEFEPILGEVATAWRKEAEKLPEGSDDRIPLLRWASDFDRSLWKEVTLADGRKAWQNERPRELRDEDSEKAQMRRQSLLMMPRNCSELLLNRPELTDEQLEGVWQQLQNWAPYEQVEAAADKEQNESAAHFLDPRHARSGLLAVLVCLGRTWLQKNFTRRTEIEGEIRKLLAVPPKVLAFTENDAHDDCEGFLARCVVQCWAAAPDNPEWRGAAGGFVTAYRYRTVQHLFDEAFHVRVELRGGYRELEALALSFSVARAEATRHVFMRMRRELDRDAVDIWCKQWLPLFEEGKGPAWVTDWSKIEKLEDFPPKTDGSHGLGFRCDELHRRDYGLDMGVVLAAFGHLPPLAEAKGSSERVCWLDICKQMVEAFSRTIPVSDSQDDELKYDVWLADEGIFKMAARRIFECGKEERIALWRPVLDLGPAAHHHIEQFLNSVLLEALGTEPPRIAELIPIWREIVSGHSN